MIEPCVRQQSPVMRAAKAAALGLTTLLGGIAVAQLLGAMTLGAVPAAVAGALIGYLLADLCSGAVHWFCDTFFTEDTPLIGRRLIWPFRDHHRDPQAITRYRLLEQDGTSYVAAMPPLALAISIGAPDAYGAAGIALHAAVCALAAGMACTNLFHKWAHMPAAPPLAAWLQRRRLILSPVAHAAHHGTHDRAYCVTSGWLNPLLDRARVFDRLGRTIRWCRPRRRPYEAS